MPNCLRRFPLLLTGARNTFAPFGLSTGQVGLAEGVYGDWGGSVTEEVRKTALTFSVQRNVYDGGGLYTSVIIPVQILEFADGWWDVGKLICTAAPTEGTLNSLRLPMKRLTSLSEELTSDGPF